MPRTLVTTICSRDKQPDSRLLPAIARYKTRRIALVEAIADEQKSDFYILSGKYGLLSGSDEIPLYDHLLVMAEVNTLTQKVMKQILWDSYDAIHFYAKPKAYPGWEPYYAVFENVSNHLKINMVVKILP